MQLKIKRLTPTAVMPKFMTDGAACFDIAADRVTDINALSATYGTGLAFEIPEGYHVKVFSRSGHGFKDGITLVNSVGIIDADYRGEVMVKLVCNGTMTAYWPDAGSRIAQCMLCENIPTEIVEVDGLSYTVRGSGGFGSTG